MHGRLSAVFRRRGERVSADWHRARASLEAEPTTAPELTLIARGSSARRGTRTSALLLAQERPASMRWAKTRTRRASSPARRRWAPGSLRRRPPWLGALYPHGTERYRLAGLGALIVAQDRRAGCCSRGRSDVAAAETPDEDDWHHWTRAAALAAILCAERGDRRGMRTWLDALPRRRIPIGAEHELRDPVVAHELAPRGGPRHRRSRGVRPGERRDAAHAARRRGGGRRSGAAVSSRQTNLRCPASPTRSCRDTSTSPRSFRAYRAVVEVLLLVWRGDIGVARDG